MRLYKCLNQTIDLDHILAISDYDDYSSSFSITFALRDQPLLIKRATFQSNQDWMPVSEFVSERDKLVIAWEKSCFTPENVDALLLPGADRP